jgi:hypothetical protein
MRDEIRKREPERPEREPERPRPQTDWASFRALPEVIEAKRSMGAWRNEFPWHL